MIINMEDCIRIYVKKVPDPACIDPQTVREFPTGRRDFILRAAKKPAAESYAAGLLLADILNVREDSDLRIDPEGGKPYLADDSCMFSLSHTAAIAVLAVSPVGIGVDTEPIRPLTGSLIRKVFTEEERRFIEKDPGRNAVLLWTRLEALLKLSGEGIPGIDTRTVSLLDPGEGIHFQTLEYDGSMISTACGTGLPVVPVSTDDPDGRFTFIR